MANYRDKNSGILYNSSQIKTNLSKAKSEFIEEFIIRYDYLFCVRCGTNQPPLNVSHNVSINDCKKSSQIELIWDKSNFELLCQFKCHALKDRLYLGNKEKL